MILQRWALSCYSQSLGPLAFSSTLHLTVGFQVWLHKAGMPHLAPKITPLAFELHRIFLVKLGMHNSDRTALPKTRNVSGTSSRMIYFASCKDFT